MTQEEKSLLLQDLCARLPYGVYIEHTTTEIIGQLKGIVFEHIYNGTDSIQDINAWVLFFGDEYVDATYFKPYLRPMSSMTKEECIELGNIQATIENISEVIPNVPYYIEVAYSKQIDWLNAHHFDYRGLINKVLALEAPKGMYK